MQAQHKACRDLGSILHLFYQDAYWHPEGLSEEQQFKEGMQALFNENAFNNPVELRYLADQLEGWSNDRRINSKHKEKLLECLIEFFPCRNINESAHERELAMEEKQRYDLLALKSHIWLQAMQLEKDIPSTIKAY